MDRGNYGRVCAAQGPLGAAKAGAAGCGGVLRTSQGELKAMSSGPISIFDSDYAEVTAIKIALEVFMEACWVGKARLIVESDSKVALCWVQFVFACRNSNWMADYLAKAELKRKDFFKAGCMEVALNLVNFNARTSLVVRDSVHVLPREMLGISTFGLLMWMLKWLPVRIVDREHTYFQKKDGMPREPFPKGWKGEDGLYAVGFTRRGLLGASFDAQRVAEDIELHWRAEAPNFVDFITVLSL
ncbi:Indole-3-pyruvate monooxygenase YUCCA6 [Hibiscus syriacus]|uniref:Indole-3-pyruvate monooxygenase YUCCA6 n=1 Tax=Hibiscus syriacus TaxID=106335 RepID=A0A6A2Z8R7_HIBSY|nr:Indole-3-pyruvate monooxygenase YUCCA6 [Hibiscus syriacus]